MIRSCLLADSYRCSIYSTVRLYLGVSVPGLYTMLIFVILAMFIAGLMVGRTPELYGKKIEPYEMTLTTIHILIPIFLILGLTTVAVLTDPGRSAECLIPGRMGFLKSCMRSVPLPKIMEVPLEVFQPIMCSITS